MVSTGLFINLAYQVSKPARSEDCSLHCLKTVPKIINNNRRSLGIVLTLHHDPMNSAGLDIRNRPIFQRYRVQPVAKKLN